MSSSMFEYRKRLRPSFSRLRPRRGIKSYGKFSARSRYALARSRLLRRARIANLRTGGYEDLEIKFYDTSLVDSQVANDAALANGVKDPTSGALNSVAQGDSESQRDGRKITMHSIFINGQIRFESALDQTLSLVSGTKVFVALVQDLQTNGAQLTADLVYTNPSSDLEGSAMPLRNLQYINRFKVLATKNLVINPQTLTYDGTANQKDTSGMVRKFTIFRKLKTPVVFSGTTANVSNITDNSLHLIVLSDLNWTPYVTYNSRVRFTG